MTLKDKVIVVTGGSRGFGKALAKAFVAEQARVIVSSHEESELQKTAKELGADCFVADATSSEATAKLGEYVAQKYGAIDIWVNNAGIQIAPSVLEDVAPEKLKKLFDINFFGYFYGCQTALRQMKKQNVGVILNVNSTAGLEGKPNLSAYVSSKFALRGMTESSRKEIVGTGLKIYQVFPGGMQTDIYKEKVPADIKEYMDADTVAAKVIQNLKSENPDPDMVVKRQKG